MTDFSPYDLLRTAILVTILLYVKFVAVNIAWAGARVEKNTHSTHTLFALFALPNCLTYSECSPCLLQAKAGRRAKEDVDNNTTPSAEELAAEEHAGMVVRNDMENLPFGLIMIWASALCLTSTQVVTLTGPSSETLQLIKRT
jgi:hypothetical protein